MVQRPWLTALAGAGAVVLVAVALAVAGAGPSTGTPAAGANPARFASAQSNRYAYWRVALDAFAAHPLKGVGSGGFRVEWRREREVVDPARDAHSLYLETAAELGLVGLLLLGAAIAAVVVSAVQARRRDAAASAGLIAALALYAVHAGHRLGLGDAGAHARRAGARGRAQLVGRNRRAERAAPAPRPARAVRGVDRARGLGEQHPRLVVLGLARARRSGGGGARAGGRFA